MDIASSTKRFDLLDGLRGIAALSVVIHHLTQKTNYPLFEYAFIAVDVFFILSGFVIMHSYGQKLTNGLPPPTYIYRRVQRLYPMFLLGLLMGLPLIIILTIDGNTSYNGLSLAVSFITNALGLPELYNERVSYGALDVSQGLIFPFNTSLWSLFFEMFASLTFLYLFKFSIRALFVCSVSCLVLWLAYGLIQQHGLGYFNFGLGWGDDNFLAGFPRVLYGFCLGMFIYKVYMHTNMERFPRFFEFLNKVGGYVFYTGLIVVLAFPFGLFGFYHIFAIVFIAPFIIFLAAFYDCTSAWELRAAQAMGWLSYPLYCVHIPVLSAVNYMTGRYFVDFSDTIFPIIAAFVLSILIAIALGRFVDEPIRHYWASFRRRNA